MITRELKNIRRIVTAAVSGKIQLFVLLFFITLMALPLILGGRPQRDPARAFSFMLTVLGGFFWFMLGSGIVTTAHHGHQLRIAGVQRKCALALLYTYVLLCVLPAFAAKSFMGILTLNTAVAAGAMLTLMVPAVWFSAMILFYLILVWASARYLPIDSAGPLTYWVIALPLMTIAWLRWRVRRMQPLGLQSNNTLLGAFESSLKLDLSNPNTMQGMQYSSWLMPKTGVHSARSFTTRLRTLFGAAPGYWQRAGLIQFLLFMVIALFLKFMEQLVTNHPGSNSAESVITRDFFIPFIVMISAIGISAQISILFRKESSDLAEASLLPKLPTQDRVIWLKRAVIHASALQGIGQAIALLLIAAFFHQLTLTKLLLAAGTVTLGTLLSTTLMLGSALNPQPKHLIANTILWVLVAACGVLALYYVIQSVLEAQLRTVAVSLIALATWVAAILFLQKTWQRKLAARPHPYIEAC